MKNDLIATPQAAKYLGDLKENTLEGWRTKGVGPRYIKIGRLVRYRAKRGGNRRDIREQ